MKERPRPDSNYYPKNHEGKGLLDAIGNTPLVKLEQIVPEANFSIFAKLEQRNPGGSGKDRAVAAMIEAAIQNKEIIPGKTIVVESSSGNTGIGLAMVCNLLKTEFIAIVDPKITATNLTMMQLYGAKIEQVTAPDGNYLQARIKRRDELQQQNPNNIYIPNQYTNPNNPLGQKKVMEEIVKKIGSPDYLFCATGTCGTISGCYAYIKEQKLQTKLIAVDAEGSLIFGKEPKNRLIPGHGASIQPPFMTEDLRNAITDVVWVSDRDCVIGCRNLIKKEGILAGGSSGGVIRAVEKYSNNIPTGSTCAIILSDRGDRYNFTDDWILENLGKEALEEIKNL